MTPRTLPEAFVAMLRGYGFAAVDPLLDALAGGEPVTAVRPNTGKGIVFPDTLGRQVPWLPAARYLDERPVFALDPAWHQGLYYVQDASSMAFTLIVKDIVTAHFGNRPIRVLDACAAPGGKSIAALEACPDGTALVCNEFDGRRARILAENIAKYGYPAVAVTSSDTKAFAALGEEFDLAIVDAPCSGEGMMRKEPEAIAQWSDDLVKQCAALQREILTNVWQALRPGGVLIFSTCTFNALENEANLAYLAEELGAQPIELPVGKLPGTAPTYDGRYPGRHFFPGCVEGEGLFAAMVAKPGKWEPAPPEGEASKQKTRKSDKTKAPKPDASALDFARSVLANPDDYVIVNKDDTFSALPVAHAAFFGRLARAAHTLRCGLPLFTLKGRDMVPAPELALSTAIRPDAFPIVDLSPDAALAYLHGNSLTDIPDGLPRGFALAACRNVPMGFIKNIGPRANNLYPDAWRLRIDSARGAVSLIDSNG